MEILQHEGFLAYQDLERLDVKDCSSYGIYHAVKSNG